MLDNETKRRIDTARDILVGKLPDPKSQVEQITIALIYKFMDDMDAQSVEFGGEPSFFVGDYEKFGWRKIFAPNIGGHELLALYGEAITSLNQNPNLPQLFRDVFKNAFLPYRDPETLKMFLKNINEFKYDHSERLGDAFEYLLSVLGSQGDAGQFRTPRHIIDFIVETLAPKKNETVCDPACGTAGFLISSFKHILKANTRQNNGDQLSPDDRRKLMQNFVGYDISPDMVRLSLVNLYLHGFPDPHIYEYDTLSSEDRWNEHFDIVMANPPFMSPKGGIKPHKKFSIQANRSEVLFVDYIAEHIHPTTGRAGIIVPEGIIFQSAGAYKDLRKMLVDKNYLYAVVSLPAGVFQPYSGVKTSVLLMDKTLAGKTDKILFVKIQNDGFGLGAQRREMATSDLPDSLNLVRDFQAAVLQGDTSQFEGEDFPLQAVAVEKTQIAADGDYNLSGDRYKVNKIQQHKFETVELGEICEFIDYRGRTPQKTDSGIRLITAKNVRMGYLNYEPIEFIAEEDYDDWMTRGFVEKGDVLFTTEAPLGNVAQIDTNEKVALAQRIIALVPKNGNLNKSFLKNILISERIQSNIQAHATGSTVYGIKAKTLKTIKIPLPPLSIQKEIVEKIEGFQRIIDGAKQVVENYKPQIDISPDWEMVELGEVCVFDYGKPLKAEDRVDGEYHVFGSNGIVGTHNDFIVKAPFIVVGRKGSAGALHYSEINGFPIDTTFFIKLENENKITLKYLYFSLFPLGLKNVNTQSGVPGLNRNDAYKLKIPLPPLEVQQEIVARIEREQSLVNSNKELITIFEAKIKDEINKLWEQDEKVEAMVG